MFSKYRFTKHENTDFDIYCKICAKYDRLIYILFNNYLIIIYIIEVENVKKERTGIINDIVIVC